MRATLLALLVTALGTSAGFAFTTSSGFGAQLYASGVPTSPAGLAFIGTTLYTVDPTDGGLFRASGVAPLAFTRVATVGVGATGIAALGGSLYVSIANGDVLRVDPLTGATLANVTSGAIGCVNAVAADPVTLDLFVTSCTRVWRIESPATTPVITGYVQLFPGGVTTYGITIGADDSIYVAATSFGQVWRIQGPTQAAGSPPTKGAVAYTSSPRGVAIIGQFLFINGADGSITKYALPEEGSGPIVALSGGDAGDLETLGPDGCVYASQGAAVIRLGDDHGGCDLVHAAPPPPPATLTLVNTSANPPLLGGGDQTFTATLANVASPGGLTITLTISGGNPQTRTAVTGPNGVVAFAYSGAHVGTDTLSATVVVNSSTVTSNSLQVIWPRALDTAAPTITYAVAGDHGANFGCPQTGVGQPGVTEFCGWFVSPPTLTWTVTANGPSGIDRTRTNCPPYTLLGVSPITGTPVTCIAYSGDGVSSSLQVRLQVNALPPSIAVASATTAATPYVAGTLVNTPVVVTFACDSAYGAAGVVSCTAPVTVSADGTASVTGTVVDVTGTSRSVTFGPIRIDKTGPTVTAVATAGGNPYVYGRPTASDVTLTFSCADAPAGVGTCPAPVTVNVAGTRDVSVSAMDTLGNTTNASFGPIVIDRTAPAVSAMLTPAPDGNGNIALSGTVHLSATDASGVASISYSASGAALIAPTTVNGSSANVTINAIGTTTVTFFATDAVGNVSAAGHVDLHIISTQPSTSHITSASFLTAGGATVSATLVGMDGVSPAAGKTITFAAGAATATGMTNESGVATATLALAPGTYTLTATFAGDTAYFPSSDRQALTAYAVTRFVVYAPNARVGATVQFYGGDWSKQIADAQLRKGFGDFKGYADSSSATAWAGTSGDKNKPPQAIPQYISVLLTTSATKGPKDAINGDVAGVAIVRVLGGDEDPLKKTTAYDGKLGNRGYGVVVSVLSH